MEILRYDPMMSPDLTSAYNNTIHNMPHCYPVSVEDFTSALASVVKEGHRHDRLNSEMAFVARESGSITGFIHLGVELSEKEKKRDQGIIRFLWYDWGHRLAGQALLSAAEDYFRERDLKQIAAFPQEYHYSFYHFAHSYLSDRLDRVHALLGFNGYRRDRGEVFLDWPNYDVSLTPADVSAQISVKWDEGKGTRPGVTVQGHQEGKEIGICECVSGGEYSQSDDAQDWLFTTWLGIAEEMQGKGLGRHLLQRALKEMQGLGDRHAAISTDWQNYRATLFYSNFGYHVVDWTYALGRNLD